MQIDDSDNLIFLNKNSGRKKEQIARYVDPTFYLRAETLEKARNLALEAGTGWDIYAIQEQFAEFNKGSDNIKNVDALFIGFVKKKIANNA